MIPLKKISEPVQETTTTPKLAVKLTLAPTIGISKTSNNNKPEEKKKPTSTQGINSNGTQGNVKKLSTKSYVENIIEATTSKKGIKPKFDANEESKQSVGTKKGTQGN
jgi:hypothetical protein